jgi:hypothetical protein
MSRVLSKNAFYTGLTKALEPNGWCRMPGPNHVSEILAKRSGDLVLCVGFDESALYRNRITAELTLGEHASLANFPDAPLAWCRVGELLEPAERESLLDADFTAPGVTDAWWVGRTIDNIDKIVEAVTLTEPRFLARPGLREHIAKSTRHRAYADRLREIAATPVPHDDDAVPPAAWVDHAATLTKAPPKQRPAIAARWAADAWRVYRVLGLKLVDAP